MRQSLPWIAGVWLALAVGCSSEPDDGGGPDEPTCDGDCIVAPAPVCDGDAVVRYASLGACTDAGCVFEVQSSTPCEFECADGACLGDPCEGLICNRPPAATCEGDIAVTWQRFGECARGECTYERRRTDCASAGAECVEGACIPIDLCEGVTCDTPPATDCSGGRVRTWVEPGTCDGGVCSWEARLTDCDAGETCQDGACVGDPACEGVVCDTPPAPVCRLGDAITWDEAGRCVGGTCVYEEQVTACVANDLVCDEGACRRDPCRDVVCARPPRNRCEGEVQVRFATSGTCADGTCSYAETRTDCAAIGQQCSSGACVDACVGVSCGTPPADDCDGDVARAWEPSGVCVAGTCEFGAIETDCAALGLICDAGRCLSECDGITCDAPPETICETATSVRRWSAVPCEGGLCDYGEGSVELCGPGRVCAGGACVASICTDAAQCTPPPRCEGDVVVSYLGEADCVDGTCSGSLSERRRDCAATGGTCADGACVADPCEGVVCDEAPPAFCDGSDAVTFAMPGVCDAGTCTWAEARETCSGTCWLGACYDGDPCDGVDCDVPPEPFCDAGVAVRWAPGGTCDNGTCSWTELRDDCTASGAFCDAGRCSDVDPCAVVTCGAVPDPSCEGTVAVAPEAPATCEDGVCTWRSTRTDCALDGRWCAFGACVDSDPCDAVTCESPPAPRCDGNTLVTSGEGACSAGDCAWTETRLPCGLEDARCLDGACVPRADVCDAVDCTETPAPRCADATTALEYTGGGVCDPDRAACDLTSVESVVPCDAGQTCLDGMCRRLAGAGEVVVTELFVTASSGAAADVWIEVGIVAPETIDLAGLTLRDGMGRAWRLDATFEAAPGERVVFGGGPGSPTGGPDVAFDPIAFSLAAEDQLVLSVGAVEIDRVVFGGGDWPAATNRSTGLQVAPDADANDDPAAWCVADDVYDPSGDRRGTPGVAALTCAAAACDDVSCDTPPADTCENLLARRVYARGVCDSSGACDYEATAVTAPCQTETGERCVDGACVRPFCASSSDCVVEPFCFGGSAFTPDGDVPCVEGTCVWADGIAIDPCEARGATCVGGACVEP